MKTKQKDVFIQSLVPANLGNHARKQAKLADRSVASWVRVLLREDMQASKTGVKPIDHHR